MTTHADKKIALFPSLMAADPLRLAQVIKTLEPYCQGFHLDVMDDHFVPNLAFGTATLNAIGKLTKKPCWLHLMVTHPAPWLQRLTLPRNSIISFHPQTEVDPLQFIEMVGKKGWIASIAINPAMPLDPLKRFIKRVEHLTIMGVKPGFSGQHFIPSVYRTLDDLNRLLGAHRIKYRIGIDGGVTVTNIAKLATYGVTDFALGSSLFNKTNPVQELQKMSQLVENV